LIVKNLTVIDCLQLLDIKPRDDEKVMSFPKLVHCIIILGNTKNLTGWKWWVLVEKLTPF